ncbi:hypothetical protein [Jannaschia formosa]|uniref:hypothetical protein n=1 Tax=Jannaschia formosa TaxID=2259592 RepID=UPI001074DD1F|nr:hypothetical protein [Jannaschia formosa]TFL16802.1 hypothetical protein DR046_18100 [Jannaschia formosa]
MTHFPAFYSLTALLIAATPGYCSPISWVCDFVEECSDGECSNKEMKLTFFVEDGGQGGAYMQGNVGFVQVTSVTGTGAVSFVETVPSGAVQSTTILQDGLAVHSRHTHILGEFILSQWTGACEYFGSS